MKFKTDTKMKTLITIISNVNIEECDLNFLKCKELKHGIYLSPEAAKKVKNCLYGGGFGLDQVIVTELHKNDKEYYSNLEAR